jgi:predicted phosphodiesterase
MEIKKREDEDNLDYLLRLSGYILEEKTKDFDWKDLVELSGLSVHPDVLRKSMQPKDFGAYAVYKHMLKKEVKPDAIETLEQKIKESKIEIQKLRDLRNGYNETQIRKEARKEAILEELKLFIDGMERFEVPEFKKIPEDNNKKLICGVADAHFGKELVIKGLMDETINVYNEEIFQERMWNLLNEYIEVVIDEGISKVTFVDLSDSINGILRQTDLMYAKYGILESSIKYAYFMAEWLNKFSEYVEIDYYACKGNHNEARVLNGKSGEFNQENTQIVIDEMLKLALSNNVRIKINPTRDLQYINIDGFKLLATHGQNENNLVSSVKEYKEIYDVDIDLLIAGHLHNSRSETVSLHSKVIQFPSIIGVDDFSMKIKKTAKAEGKAILLKGNKMYNIDIVL